ncbi:MAG TPA: cyclic nucleotide-binding domain-containing protein [Polyangiaceae bacterium]|nr:cyclic nucleotide-binding domain-containing protein [Polyangiaceae bacterium]
MQSSTAGSRPIDRALHAYGTSDARAALRHALPVLERELPPLALALVAKAALELAPDDELRQTLEGAVRVAIDAGNLPAAVVAASWMRSAGSNPSRAYDSIAEAYGRGSPRLSQRLPVAQDLPQAPLDVHALPETTSDAELFARARSAAQAARAAWAERSASPLPWVPLFSTLDRDVLRSLLAVFDARVVSEGKRVIGEGELGSEAYVVARGELDVERRTADGVQRVHLARLGAGSLVGEMALVSRAVRTASVTAARPSVLLVASKAELDRVAISNPGVAREVNDYCRRRMIDSVARTSPLFHNVSSFDREALVDRFQIRSFEPGERILVQGRPCDGLYLIAAGNAAVVKQEDRERSIVSQLGPGALIGEVALVLRKPVDREVVAQHPTITLHLPREGFLDIMRAHPRLFVDLYALALQSDEDPASLESPQPQSSPDSVLV